MRPGQRHVPQHRHDTDREQHWAHGYKVLISPLSPEKGEDAESRRKRTSLTQRLETLRKENSKDANSETHGKSCRGNTEETQEKQTEGLRDPQKLLMLCTGLGHFKSGKVVFGKAVQTAHGGASQGCGHEMSLSLLTPAAASRGRDVIRAGVWSPRSHSRHSGPHFPLLWGRHEP